jgi:CHAT domain-containing protein
VVTHDARARYELNASPSALRDKVLEVRDVLRSPTPDPRQRLSELYTMLVAPIDGELRSLEQDFGARHAGSSKPTVPTILWSLDGSLRYVLMAALYDGRRYMAERFNNVLFTPESYGHFASPGLGNPQLRALAVGLSRSYRGMPALPGVIPELQSVVHDPGVPASHGPLDGSILSDEMFTFTALKTRLAPGSTIPVIHIASHFVMQSSKGEEPYLMLGGDDASAPDGYPLTLSRLEDSPISFHGTRLLTLSACSTAKGDAVGNGIDIESLAMIAQRKDAEAVLATLWGVNDASTSQLMKGFYARWSAHPDQGKAEALRQTQLAFLRGFAHSTSGTDSRGIKSTDNDAASAHPLGYSHPYYWASFVLTGGYQ